jgi:flagellum-specific peptidoglycan hydrolase FlgJ
MTKREFLEDAHAAAVESSKQSGMPALVTVAQAALESNWGASELSQQARNYFGIKAHKGHGEIVMATHECAHGAEFEVHAAFASYGSMLECFRCRDGILARGAVYATARQKLGDEQEFIVEMAKHWATDPHYSAKLKAMLEEVKGTMR